MMILGGKDPSREFPRNVYADETLVNYIDLEQV